MRRSKWNNLRVLFNLGINIKFVTLLNICMVWSKLINNGMKSLTLLFYLMVLDIIMLINVCVLKFVMTTTIVCIYVDDMLILNDDIKGVIETKRFLSSTFKMKDLGQVDTISSIKVKQHSGAFALSQSHYIEKVLM